MQIVRRRTEIQRFDIAKQFQHAGIRTAAQQESHLRRQLRELRQQAHDADGAGVGRRLIQGIHQDEHRAVIV